MRTYDGLFTAWRPRYALFQCFQRHAAPTGAMAHGQVFFFFTRGGKGTKVPAQILALARTVSALSTPPRELGS